MKILHTADWQIGMRVRQAGSRASDVRSQRIASAAALADVARAHGVDAVFVAGDVFEDNAVDRADVQRVIDACVSFGVPTYVLPGNHDPLTTGSVWEHPSWEAAPNVHVLRSASPIEMRPGVTLYPCPALTAHSSVDPTRWIGDSSAEGTRIGIAHGTVVDMGLSVDEDCFPIRYDAASRLGLDYIALGHWHSTAPYEGDIAGARMAYSGTHEPTRFNERDSGNVLVVEVPGRNAVPKLTRVATGALRWVSLVREIANKIDVDRLIADLGQIPEPSKTLLELRLSGVLVPEQMPTLEQLSNIVKARFPLMARIDQSQLVAAPGDHTWAETLPAGLLRDVAAAISRDADEASAQALQLLYRFGIEKGQVTV